MSDLGFDPNKPFNEPLLESSGKQRVVMKGRLIVNPTPPTPPEMPKPDGPKNVPSIVPCRAWRVDEDGTTSIERYAEGLQAENAALRAALEEIANYDKEAERKGLCPYGCDTPNIAHLALHSSPAAGGKDEDE